MQEYCNSLTKYSRFETREVRVGEIGVGGTNPIRIQSMTTTDTMDTKGTIDQSIRMIKAGCEIVRITAPSIKEAKNLKEIKDGIRARGFNNPIVADIHFTPNAAEIAARIVEKVRINPGNYLDRKRFKEINYTDESYLEELDRIHEKFTPLVNICKKYGTAMRIGTNHGSLSDRILSRYGDTPEGMVESALEFLRIAESLNYYDIILSMKASNTRVMVQAYRLLVKKMVTEGMNYPLHLGVTEAGEAEDGRIKSSVGISTLLLDGLGDTIRVSLTEKPEAEIPVCKKIVKKLKSSINNGKISPIYKLKYDPYFYSKRKTAAIAKVGGKNDPVVIGDLSDLEDIKHGDLIPFGYIYSEKKDKWHISDQAVDFIYVGNSSINFKIPGTLGIIQDYKSFVKREQHFPIYQFKDIEMIKDSITSFLEIDAEEEISKLTALSKNIIIILKTKSKNYMMVVRKYFIECLNNNITNPVLLKKSYNQGDKTQLMINASSDFGGIFIDGFGDGLWIRSKEGNSFNNQLAFGILQACRSRISKTEYISCPSCGRTLFDLQQTTQKIRSETNHLKGIKIGIMGCIVNGPGEMADADYGYVGIGTGKIALYKGQKVIKTNIDESDALDALINLIKANGDWRDIKEV